MSQLEIVEYQHEHKEQVIDLILHIQQVEYNVPITLDEQSDLLDVESFYQQSGGNFWVALYDGEVVGTMSFIKFDTDELALRKVFVKKEFRGGEYKIAHTLLEHAMSWARDNQFKMIYLGTTLQFKAAHRFYEKYGFEEIEKTDLPELFPVVHVDKKFYQYKL